MSLDVPIMSRLDAALNPMGETNITQISPVEFVWDDDLYAGLAVGLSVSTVERSWGGGTTFYDGVLTIDIASKSPVDVRAVGDKVRASLQNFGGPLDSGRFHVTTMLLLPERFEIDQERNLALVNQQYDVEWAETGA